MIRTTLETDCDALIALATASGLFDPEQTGMLAGMLRSPDENDVWFTDEDAGVPVGVAYAAPEKMTHGTWNLYWIAITPDRQLQGRGKAMLEHVQEWLIEKRQRIILVETAGVDELMTLTMSGSFIPTMDLKPRHEFGTSMRLALTKLCFANH